MIKNPKIIIPVNEGISYRFIFQTDIFKSLQKKSNLIIILAKNKNDSFYDSLRSYDNVIIEDYKESECEDFLKSSRIHNILRIARSFIQNNKYDITTIQKNAFDTANEFTWVKRVSKILNKN